MTRLLAWLLLLAAPAAAQDRAAETAAADAAARERITAAITGSGFAGTYMVYAGPRRIAGGGVGAAVEGQPGGFEPGVAWPWASVTGQAMAVLAMQEVEKGRLSLDAPVRRYLPGSERGTTVRRLLRASASEQDQVALGRLLERTTRTPLPQLFALRIAEPLGLTAGFIAPDATAPDAAWPGGPTPEERRAIAEMGAAGALVGTATDLATFDRALLSDTLLTAAMRDRMWQDEAVLTSLSGCVTPVRVVERRGAIGRFAVRNLLLPDLGISAVLFTNRGDAGFDGEGRGITHAVLSAAACG